MPERRRLGLIFWCEGLSLLCPTPTPPQPRSVYTSRLWLVVSGEHWVEEPLRSLSIVYFLPAHLGAWRHWFGSKIITAIFSVIHTQLASNYNELTWFALFVKWSDSIMWFFFSPHIFNMQTLRNFHPVRRSSLRNVSSQCKRDSQGRLVKQDTRKAESQDTAETTPGPFALSKRWHRSAFSPVSPPRVHTGDALVCRRV